MVKKKTLLLIIFSFLFNFSREVNSVANDILNNQKILTLSFFANSQNSNKKKDSNLMVSISMLDKVVNFFNEVILLGEDQPETRTLAFLDILSNLKKYLFVAQATGAKDPFVETACKYINIQYHNMIIMKNILKQDEEISSENGDHEFELLGFDQIKNEHSKSVINKASSLIKGLSNIFLQKNSCHININFTQSQSISNEFMQAMVSRGKPSDEQYLALSISKDFHNYNINIIFGSELFNSINSEILQNTDSQRLSGEIEKLAKQLFCKFALKLLFLNPITKIMDPGVTEDFLNNYSEQLLSSLNKQPKLAFELTPLPKWQDKIVNSVCLYYENPFATAAIQENQPSQPNLTPILTQKTITHDKLWSWDEVKPTQKKLGEIRDQIQKAKESLSQNSRKETVKILNDLEGLFERPKNLEDILDKTIFAIAYSDKSGKNEFLQKKSKSKLQTFLSGLISMSSHTDTNIPTTPYFSIDFIHRKEEAIINKSSLPTVMQYASEATNLAKLGLPFNGRITLFQLINDLATIVDSLDLSSLSINFLIVYSKILDFIKSAELKIGRSKKSPTWESVRQQLFTAVASLRNKNSQTIEGFFTNNFGLRKIRLFFSPIAQTKQESSSPSGNFSLSNHGQETKRDEIIFSSIFNQEKITKNPSIQRRTVYSKPRR